MRPVPRPRVILRHCDAYDPERIRAIVREGLAELGLRPHGRTLIKPNVVLAGGVFKHAYTRPQFVEGVIGALRDRDEGGMRELAVGERCAITVPTRYAFREAGYDEMLTRTGTKRYHFDETPQVEIRYTHARRLRDFVFTPEPVAHADFFVNCPKFKAHPWTTVTLSMKNYIGIQDDRHRLIDHDHALDRKVADLQHIVQPRFVAIDCIVAGEGRMLTPVPRRMNLVIMGNNQVAVDAVGCRILGLDPLDVAHIRFAHDDGFGPVALDRIALSGDVSLDEARERANGFQVGLTRVEKYFEGTRIHAYAGPPPDHGPAGYCWGGCPGALEEAVEVLRAYDAHCDRNMPHVHLVFGKYDGPLDVSYGEKLVFVGDCVSFDGRVGNELVQIHSKYVDRSQRDPLNVHPTDVYQRMLGVARLVKASRHEPYIRMDGCPVSVAELILLLSELGEVNNPYFDPREIVRFNRAYLAWRAATAFARVRGRPYQIAGPAERGEARPETSEGERG